MNLYCAVSGSKQTLAPNRLWHQTNHYCTDSGSKRITTAQSLAPKITTAQSLAPNESLLRSLWLQTDSGTKRITIAQTLAPNESLLRSLWHQMNHYCAVSGTKRITTAQSLAPNESLLRRLGHQTNHYCAESGSKWCIFHLMTVAILWMFWLQFSIVEGRGDAPSIFFKVYDSNRPEFLRIWIM